MHGKTDSWAKDWVFATLKLCMRPEMRNAHNHNKFEQKKSVKTVCMGGLKKMLCEAHGGMATVVWKPI